MLEILAPAFWVCLAAYATWYFTSAKRYAPLTHDEARILWKIHKLNARCHCKKWQGIKRRGKIVGFQCDCGYRHIQRCPIVIDTPAPNIQMRDSQNPALENLHTTYR